MARTLLTIQDSSRLTPLVNPTQNVPDAANGNSVDNSSHRVIFYVRNTGGADRTMTVQIPGTLEGENLPDKVYTIAAGTRVVLGPFNTTYDATDEGVAQRLLIDWDASTDLTIEVIKVPQA